MIRIGTIMKKGSKSHDTVPLKKKEEKTITLLFVFCLNNRFLKGVFFHSRIPADMRIYTVYTVY